MKKIVLLLSLIAGAAATAIAQTTFWTPAGTWANPHLTGTTAAIGGSALTAGSCATGTVTITGATTSMVATVSPVANPGSGMAWFAFVSASNTVTVKVCAMLAGTPTSTTYNVRIVQ